MAHTVEPLLVDQPVDLRPVRVVSIPAGHPYVQRISASPSVSVLSDPPVPGAPAGVWWPPVALDPAWIAENASSAQLLHVHFGTESLEPGRLTECLDAAHAAGWPVVFTVHDLEHPQLQEQDAYGAQLDELVVGADAVTTLTAGAARTIRDRWQRDAVVIPHPSLLPPDFTPARVRPSDDVRIGVHLKDLRPNVEGPETVAATLEAVAVLRAGGTPAVAEIRLHHRVRDEGARDEVRRLCEDATETATLIEHERLSDAELGIALSRLDACVLPYRFGTHSGWLELCWDLGVPVVAPAVGRYAEQHRDASVAVHQPGRASSLADGLRSVLTGPLGTRSGSPERTALIGARRVMRADTDAAAADAHAQLYRRLVAERDA